MCPDTQRHLNTSRSLRILTFGISKIVFLVILVFKPCGTAAQINVPKYGIFEIKLTAAENHGNSYLRMPGDSRTPGFVVGTFKGPKNERITIDGFWDGGNTWKIRMAPTAVGQWRYTTSSSDRGLGGKTGSFRCIPSNAKGFLRVNPKHPHHFMWDDGTPLYWAPVSMLIANFDDRDALGGTRRVDDGTLQRLQELRAKQGFNVTHWGYYGFNKPEFNKKTQRNEGGAPFTNYDPDILNPAYHQYGDQRVRLLLERGLVPQFVLGWPDQGIIAERTRGNEARIRRFVRYLRNWFRNNASVSETQLKRYWRYIIARYAAYNVTWNLFGEADEFGSTWETIVNDFGELTRRWDPYKHLMTTHLTGGPTPRLASQLWYDYIMLQLPTTETSRFLTYKKPVVNAEYGGYEDFQVDGETLRQIIWDVRMRGGYFVYESWGTETRSAGARYASLANLFFQHRTRFWLLEYHPELFGGTPGLANPEQEYVLYVAAGATVTVNLKRARAFLQVEWYNPRTGAYVKNPSVTTQGPRSFSPPDTKDWVLHIYTGS